MYMDRETRSQPFAEELFMRSTAPWRFQFALTLLAGAVLSPGPAWPQAAEPPAAVPRTTGEPQLSLIITTHNRPETLAPPS